MERGEVDAEARYAAALAQAPGDRQLILEQAEAALSAGNLRAIERLAQAVSAEPDWDAGLIALARIRWEELRDPHFAEPVRAVLGRDPGRTALWADLCGLLAAAGQPLAAADLAREARAHTGSQHFAVLEAIHASAAGELDRASDLFAQLPAQAPGLALHRTTHLVRLGELDHARNLLDHALEEQSDSVAAWGLAELLWRRLGDPRSAWLSGAGDLVGIADLGLSPARLDAIAKLLLDLHRHGAEMVEQSVRSGRQTRWRLFDRPEPELAELRNAIIAAVASYQAKLPPVDPRHPLLKHRDRPLALGGSWSVLFQGVGYHSSHIHNLGLVSSALYLLVADAPAGEGQLELGRPPANFNLDLPPLHTVAPVRGRMALFPSYFYHGTTPISSGERMSVAFDLIRHPAPRLAAEQR